MAWCYSVEKQLPEPMMTPSTDACHQVSRPVQNSKQKSITEILYGSHSIICYGPTDNTSAFMKVIARFQLLTVNRWWWRATWRYVVSLSHSEPFGPVQVMTCAPETGTSNYIPQYLWGVITCACPWYLIRALSYYCDMMLSQEF